MTWINLGKPNDATYTNVGKPNDATYTRQAKPNKGSIIKPGYYMGPLGLTYNVQRDVSSWTLVHKPE